VRENAYNGDYTLIRFTTTDDFENTATYRGDGSVSRTPNGRGPATHDLDPVEGEVHGDGVHARRGDACAHPLVRP
jgi:hypothetical protein